MSTPGMTIRSALATTNAPSCAPFMSTPPMAQLQPDLITAMYHFPEEDMFARHVGGGEGLHSQSPHRLCEEGERCSHNTPRHLPRKGLFLPRVGGGREGSLLPPLGGGWEGVGWRDA